jgi:hypothetical protein
MMDDNRPEEEAVAGMIRMAYDTEHRPDARLKEQTLAYLLSTMLPEKNTDPFPRWIQTLLTIGMGLLAVTLAVILQDGRFFGQAYLQVLLASVIVGANLLFAPVAGLTIILRRRHD